MYFHRKIIRDRKWNLQFDEHWMEAHGERYVDLSLSTTALLHSTLDDVQRGWALAVSHISPFLLPRSQTRRLKDFFKWKITGRDFSSCNFRSHLFSRNELIFIHLIDERGAHDQNDILIGEIVCAAVAAAVAADWRLWRLHSEMRRWLSGWHATYGKNDCSIFHVRLNGRVKLMWWYSVEPLNELPILWWFVSFVLLSICINCIGQMTANKLCRPPLRHLVMANRICQFLAGESVSMAIVTVRDFRSPIGCIISSDGLFVISKRIENYSKMIHWRARESFLCGE